MSERLDVAIVGGGLVGASLAIALAPTGKRVALIEAAAPPSGEPSWDERCIAVNAASHRIFSALGVWEELAAFAEPIVSTHISERGRFGVARFTAQQAGLPALGYNIPVRALGQQLWSQAKKTATEVFCPAQLEGIDTGADAVSLRLKPEPSGLSARLVVAADGAQSALRGLLGIGAETRDYGQHAIVTAVRPARAHAGCAYERFTPDGPIALLPKPEGACSLVWTVPSERVQMMLGWDEEKFMDEAQQAFGERLGVFKALGRRSAYPLSRVLNEQLTAPRVLFAGNAAQSLHPVAAQGFNLGLRDIAAIAELLADAPDAGSAELLKTYAQRRRHDREGTADFTDQLVRLFSNRVPGLSALRHLGLLVLDLAPPLKERVMWQNLGYRGATPRMARASDPSPPGGEGRVRGS